MRSAHDLRVGRKMMSTLGWTHPTVHTDTAPSCTNTHTQSDWRVVKPHLKLAPVIGLSLVKLLISAKHSAKHRQLQSAAAGAFYVFKYSFTYTFRRNEETVLALPPHTPQTPQPSHTLKKLFEVRFCSIFPKFCVPLTEQHTLICFVPL